MEFGVMKKVDAFFRDNVFTFGSPVSFEGGMTQMQGKGNSFWLDGVNGSANNDGRSPRKPFLNLTQALAAMTAKQHDTLYWIGGDTSVTDTAQVDWNKDYCHIVGIATPTTNARCKHTATSLTTLAGFKVSAKGCSFSNIRFWQGTNLAHCGAVEVTGSQNFFYGCSFFGQVTTLAKAGANSYSLFLNGAEECKFVACTVGADTVVRSDGAPLKLDGSCVRNIFKECLINSACETAAKSLVKFVDTAAIDRYLMFDNCTFLNFSVNHANVINEVFTIPASAATHDIILKHCASVGITQWAANDRGSIWVIGGTPAAGIAGVGSTGIAVEPT